MFKNFWRWYEKYYTLNLALAAALFALQIIHLYWLTAHVVSLGIFGRSFFELTSIWQIIMVFVDYTEIPALITTSLVYIHELRKKYSFKSILYLIFLNSQWLHIFWITDEFVVEQFTSVAKTTILPLWLAWIAIAIDYLELPVIFDTIKRLYSALRKKQFKKIGEILQEKE